MLLFDIYLQFFRIFSSGIGEIFFNIYLYIYISSDVEEDTIR